MDVAELSMFLDTLGMGKGDQSTSEFEEAAAAVKSCKNLDDTQKLQLSSKVVCGCRSLLYIVESLNHPVDNNALENVIRDAWKSFSGMPPQNASLSYIYIVSTLLKPDDSGEIPNFGDNSSVQGMGNIISTLKSADRSQWSDSFAIFQAIESEDLPALEKILLVKENNIHTEIEASEYVRGLTKQDNQTVAQLLDLRDPLGLTPLIFAADRGITTIVSLLLSCGAEVNAVENDGNTALMLAVVCEHVDIIKLLLLHGAKIDIQNKLGETALTIDDVSDEIRSLLLGS